MRRLFIVDPALVGGTALLVRGELEAVVAGAFERRRYANAVALHQPQDLGVVARPTILLEVQRDAGRQGFFIGLLEPFELHWPRPRAALAAGQHPIEPGIVEFVARCRDRLDRSKRGELADPVCGGAQTPSQQ